MPRPSRRRITLPHPPASLRTRPPLERFQRILSILRNQACPSRQTLAAELEVTTKTVQRDINFLRDRFRAPIEYDRLRGGYFLADDFDDLPNIDLTSAELVSIFIAQKALRAYRGTAFEAPLRTAFEKLAHSLDGQVSLPLHELESSISFRHFEARPIDLKIFQTLATAVQKQKLVEIDYLKLGATRPARRKFEPYHLTCVQAQWYAIGHDLKSRDIRTFHLGRIRSARLLPDGFDRPRGFDIQHHLAGSFGIFAGKGSHHILLQFDPWAARLIRERTWHPSQKLQELTHGGLELSLHLNSLEEIESWILSWGAHVRVLAPRELQSRIHSTAQAILNTSTP